MRTIVLLLTTIGGGAALGYGQHLWKTYGEENRFDISKAVGHVPVAETTEAGELPTATVVDGLIYNFGTMDKGETRQHTFVIRNDGKVPLKLKLRDTSCKCTLAEFDEAEVPPGGTQPVTLEWKSPDYTDAFSQNARIQTNDPSNRLLELRVIGRISVPIRPMPEQLFVGEIPVAEGFEGAIDLLAFKADSLQVASIEWLQPDPDRRLEVVPEPIAADDPVRVADPTIRSGVRLKVRGPAGLPLGPLRGDFRVVTDPPTIEPFDLSVQGRVVGDYTIDTLRRAPFDPQRNMIDMGTIPASQSKSLEISLIVRGGAAETVEISIDPQEIDPNAVLKAEVMPKRRLGAITSIPIRIDLVGRGETFSRLGPTPELLGKIVVRTTDPTTPVIDVYVKFALTQ